MSCKGLKGREYKRCMKEYVGESKRFFPTFNQATDTVSNTANSNNLQGLRYMHKKSNNPKVIEEIKNSISKPIYVNSNIKGDKYPFKLKTHRKKQ